MPYRVEDVSVIIVNFNGGAVLARAIESVLRLTPSPGELIVLDNGSTDDSLAIIQRYLSDARVRPIVSHENLGVAGGRNLAVSQALHPLLGFLDADGEALPEWLVEAVAALNRYPDAGAVAPLVLMEGGQRINGAGSVLDAAGHGHDRLWGEDAATQREQLQAWAELPVDYAMGCGLVLRGEGGEAIWPLDDTLLKWHDDTEIGIRLARLGFVTRFIPASRLLHWPGHSNPINPLARHAQAEQARFYLLLKYYPRHVLGWSLAHYLLHAASGSRRDPSRLDEARALLGFLWRHRHRARTIRKQWPSRRPRRFLRLDSGR
ncbi:MAG: glycosyltransferase family 2 protein [Thermaerobacter sp.]|nr:glycosyltransferase family 2 protein [Thermaerobacter sp.]